MKSYPNSEEVKQVVFSMNPNSAVGPIGMSGKFFHICWDITKNGLFKVVVAFFCGHSMLKYMTHSFLVLIPKVEHPNKLSKFRPISLRNFSNKIIYKLLSIRFSLILENHILENQSGFVRGRSIFENIMLSQEIIHNIKTQGRGQCSNQT